MPTYEYRCENGHTFETIQRMAEDPLSECEVCGAPCQRVLYAPSVHFKGSGFYTTDYGSKKGSPKSGDSESKSSDSGSGGSDSGSSDSSSGSSDSNSSSSSDSSSSSSSSNSGSSSGRTAKAASKSD